MFNVCPGLDHLYPSLGLAWALRNAGHEVVVATSGVSVAAAANAGLAVRDVSPGADFASIFPRTGSNEDRARLMRERGMAMTESLETPDVILEKFSRVSDLMLDGTLSLAREWQPDLIVYSRLQGTALIAARALGVPAVEHGFSFLREGNLPRRFLPYLAPLYERTGTPVELPEVTALYFAPDYMMHGEGEGLTMCSVPFHGGGTVPDWAVEPKRRPRICVTLGTVVPHVTGASSLTKVLDAAAETDAEFVLALGDNPDLGGAELPSNVRVVGWTALNMMLWQCDAIIHHAGCATTLASAHAGIPQLALPQGADNWINAALIERTGLGLSRESEDVDAGLLNTLLHDEGLRASARAASAALAKEPGPDQLVARLVTLAERK
ncbi:nucleotide disphospho-sugar-binding domain-containing protein [Streptomyces sp. CAU 1734]|uniref:glycosyltransferase n=1 Tax=Streptomyces sp. CAU 1734 TaxID=3140360 RepID=UPI003260CBEA